MRKVWPSEDNCIMPNDQFGKVNFTLRKFLKEIFLMVRNLAISHHEEIPCENFARRIQAPCKIPLNPLFLHARTTDFPKIFSLIFSRVNSFCNLVFSRHKALSCNFAIYKGAQHLQKEERIGWDDWGIDPLYINLEIYKALFFSLFSCSSLFLFSQQPNSL